MNGALSQSTRSGARSRQVRTNPTLLPRLQTVPSITVAVAPAGEQLAIVPAGDVHGDHGRVGIRAGRQRRAADCDHVVGGGRRGRDERRIVRPAAQQRVGSSEVVTQVVAVTVGAEQVLQRAVQALVGRGPRRIELERLTRCR